MTSSNVKLSGNRLFYEFIFPEVVLVVWAQACFEASHSIALIFHIEKEVCAYYVVSRCYVIFSYLCTLLLLVVFKFHIHRLIYDPVRGES